MKIRPLYDRIVVQRIEEKETQRGGIIIPDSAKEKPQEGKVLAVGKGKMLEDGKVLAVGKGKMLEDGRIFPLDVKVGQKVLFGKYAGNEIKLDGEEYTLMREDEVLGILE